ncbi:hypothetical protein FEM03_18505 [Phragmitibacter flavus]|uniref:HTH cro/C1-type domain-containing protein n=1 Tax=Phragmitibacter flavus TaxID=2576071 RepID=A0A5R8KAL5_9BACT|nr:helix-turn-helix domain-containing protein [Phragmitibacter flavus]TLD69360.1 hypothetical protein FEM03_18505 [Phragmitibacter flavus]
MSLSLGSQLRQARTKRGLSLLDVAHKTRIPAARLQDLEDDNYNSHGGLTYAKSFLRTYSAFLKVDASAILDQLQPPPLAGAKDYRYLVSNLGPWIRSRQFRARRPERRGAARRGSYVTTAMVTGGIVLLGGGLMFANAMFNFGAKTEEAPVASPPSASVRSLPAISSVETAKVSWIVPAHTSALTIPSETTDTAANHPIPVAIPVDSKTGELLKPSQILPAPVKAIPVED